MKKNIILAALLSVSLLTACSAENSVEDASNEDVSNEATIQNEEAVNIKELVEKYSSVKMENESASITPTQLVIKDSNDKETIYDVSGEDFFVSIAPYENETHP